jgi:hypothetical protein
MLAAPTPQPNSPVVFWHFLVHCARRRMRCSAPIYFVLSPTAQRYMPLSAVIASPVFEPACSSTVSVSWFRQEIVCNMSVTVLHTLRHASRSLLSCVVVVTRDMTAVHGLRLGASGLGGVPCRPDELHHQHQRQTQPHLASPQQPPAHIPLLACTTAISHCSDCRRPLTSSHHG